MTAKNDDCHQLAEGYFTSSADQTRKTFHMSQVYQAVPFCHGRPLFVLGAGGITAKRGGDPKIKRGQPPRTPVQRLWAALSLHPGKVFRVASF